MQDDWYCRYVTVKTPDGDYVEFPCFRWLVDDKEVVLRDGRAFLPQDDKTSLVKQHRQKELDTRRKTIRWKEWQPGIPMSIDSNRYNDLLIYYTVYDSSLLAGNLYIVDFEILEGISANCTDPQTVQYLAAPICLLYKGVQNKILPIAIQLGQNPDKNPIFLPTDGQYDWLLAKIWVRSADFQYHQNVTHLLRTHLITEVFAIAMFRQLPAVHPVFKLLIPHIRFTIAINTKAREQLICEHGIFDKANATGGGGHVQLIQKATKDLTFRSLCFPDAIKSRGVDSEEDLPTYFYRDDGYKVWDATKSFVSDVVSIYYNSDERVREDEEIQAFVKDACSFGMQDFDHCEFPKSLKSLDELIEYLTVVIFTASAQHAAVNFGQYDWCSWIPNAPSTMRKPPPQEKGLANVNTIIESLPDRGRSSWHLGAVWALSQYQENELYLGMYPDEHFIEKPVKAAMEKFRKKLSEITGFIKGRNEGKKLPYYNMSPDKIPNSVAV
uniref:Arachidonate 5-lipoxygenase n=1 Tax=Nothobranchius rachovii TaxID=451742 RepID=A0A1A8QD00_9TELE